MRDPAACVARGARGRERVTAQFSLDVEANRIAEVYRTLV
jgi:mannosyltransferase